MEQTTRESRSFKSQCGEFFFRKEIPYGMAAVRIAISGLMLCVMGTRWPHVRELFSTDGAPAPIADNYGFYNFLPVLPGTWAVALYTLMLLLMFTLMVGWKTRISAVGVLTLFTYFTLLDSLSTLTKYSAITTHVFFLLSLSACGEVWSVDRFQKLKRQGISKSLRFLSTAPKHEIWPQRLLQMFIGIVYLGAAVTKMHTAPYFTGDQMRFWLLTNVNNSNPIGEAMSEFPAMLVVFSYVAIIWEILFVFLVWRRFGRWAMLGLGAVFHAMTTITLGLYVFPVVCFSIYFSFLTTEDVIWWRAKFLRLTDKLHLSRFQLRVPRKLTTGLAYGATSLGDRGFVVAMSVLVCGAVVLERSMDVYGQRSASGPYELQVMNESTVTRMRSTDTTIREQDKLLSFDIGEYLIGGLVTDYRKSFKQGTHLYLQANLIPPHGDLYMECNLHDEEGRLVERTGSIVTRNQLRYTFCYDLPISLEPGNYQFVLRSNSKQIATKTISVLPLHSRPKTELLGN
ncbi:MAG: HTTM domain-containing protein [Planctomycetaceae bacterium]|nr:HTTM domain-containing protein [Planctomycetaceae bacterium]